jgi:hypothetical protein
MNVNRNAQQNFARPIKRQPPDDQAQAKSHCPRTPPENGGFSMAFRLPEKFAQTGRANHAILVFDDTFAAEKVAAFRATCHRFTGAVVEALALVKLGHAKGCWIVGG